MPPRTVSPNLTHRASIMKTPALPLLLCALTLPAQTLPQQLDQLLTNGLATTHCPGLSLTVAQNNRIVYSGARGLADLEQNVPMTTASVHRLASVSKPITGTILMDLVQHGKLALDAPIRQYLPELPAAYQPITLRQLLSHQSGIIHDTRDMFFNMTHYATTRDALQVFVDVPLRFPPGTKTEYSSPAFAVAGAAAEAVTGKSFQQLSADFFAAHGIEGITLDDFYAIVPHRVRGYSVDRTSTATFQDGTVATHDYLAGTPGAVTQARPYDISARYPAGGFVSSAGDLIRFVIAVGTGKVLPMETVAQMWTGQATADGTQTEATLGWGTSQRDGRTMIGMNGATTATTTSLRYFPASGTAVALLCNAEGAQDLDQLLEAILTAALP